MELVKRFLGFWCDFVLGDDWTVAVAVVALLALSGALAHFSLQTAAWVLMPIGVAFILAVSLRRAVPQ